MEWSHWVISTCEINSLTSCMLFLHSRPHLKGVYFARKEEANSRPFLTKDAEQFLSSCLLLQVHPFHLKSFGTPWTCCLKINSMHLSAYNVIIQLTRNILRHAPRLPSITQKYWKPKSILRRKKSLKSQSEILYD